MDGSAGREIEFDLTRAGADGYGQTSSTKNSKSVKHVSFKQETPDAGSPETITKTISSQNLRSSPRRSSPYKKKTEMMPEENLTELANVLAEIQKRNNMVKAGLEGQLTCENPKLLEVLMEHVVLNWDELAEDLLRDEIDNM